MSNTSITKLLLVEDSPGDARLLREMLNEEDTLNTELTHVQYMSDAERHLAQQTTDIILLDLGLPDAQGLEAVRRARAAAPRVPLVVLTGLDDESLAAQALQEGAQDYLIKGDISTRGLLRALRYAMERNTMDEELFVEKERAQVTLNSIGDAVVCTDISGNITFLNIVAERTTGWSRQEAVGRPMAEVLRDTASRKIIADPMAMAVGLGRAGSLPLNCILVRRDGFEVPIEDSVAPIHDRKGKVIGAVIVFRDVSAARALALALQISHSAEHDFLTGLPHALARSNPSGDRSCATPHEAGRGVVLGFGWLQAHQRFPGTCDRRQASSIHRKAPGGLRARLRHGQPTGRR